MKYCIKVGIDRYPVKEDEVPKIIQAMATNAIVTLNSGVFSGKAINAIVRDIHAERGFNYHHQLSGGDEVSVKDFEIDIKQPVAIANNGGNLLN